MSKVMLYACGGAGINIAKQVKEADMNNIDIAFVDSSESNLRDVQDKAYTIKGMDGAGKVRALTYAAFVDEVEAALSVFEPSDKLNVVISSLSGGTGSIIGPLIAKKLIEEGKTVIVIGITSTTSTIELENSIKTIQTYNNFAINLNSPIAMFYNENGDDRSNVDNRVVSFMEALNLVTDTTRTEEFDRTDLLHFVSYNKVTGLPVGLSMINLSINGGDPLIDFDVVDNEQHLTTHIATTILMVGNRNSELIGVNKPEYLAKVVITDPSFSQDENSKDIRIDNIVGLLPVLVTKLTKDLDVIKNRIKSARIHDIGLVDSGNGGVVL